MKALNQYIELYKEQKDVIENTSAPGLNAQRAFALEALAHKGLPVESDENYLHSNVEEWLAPNYGLNIQRLNLPLDTEEPFRCSVPNLSTQLYFLNGDSFMSAPQTNASLLPDGVIVKGLNTFACDYPEIFSRYYNKSSFTDGTSFLNTLLVQDGFVVYVPKNVVVEKPIQLIELMQSQFSMLACRRILLILEQGAALKLLLCDHSLRMQEYLSLQVVEAFVEDNASLELYDLEETHTGNSRISSLYVNVGNDSRFVCNNITLHNGRTRNSANVAVNGHGAEIVLNGIVIADKEQHVDNYTFIDHNSCNSTSRELFKYVLSGSSVGAFKGKVLVRGGAQGTDSQQTNRNLALTSSARMFAEPQLEIYADNVKCSHGATVGQLDQAALFYMRQRGISEQEAKMLLKEAFVGEVIDSIPLAPLRDRLNRLISLRFRGQLAQCKGCNICH